MVALGGYSAAAEPDVDIDDFNAFYRAYVRRVRGLIRRRINDRELAEDLVQDTFVKASRALDRFDRTRSVWPWLATIATNLCFDALRKAARSTDTGALNLDDHDWVDAHGDPAERFALSETREGVQDALASLGHRHRRVLALKELEGWRVEDLARLESTTTDAVRSVLTRARKAFRDSYSELAQGRGLAAMVGVGVAGLRRFRTRVAAVRTRLVGFRMVAAAPMELVAGAVAVSVIGCLTLASLAPHPAIAVPAPLSVAAVETAAAPPPAVAAPSAPVDATPARLQDVPAPAPTVAVSTSGSLDEGQITDHESVQAPQGWRLDTWGTAIAQPNCDADPSVSEHVECTVLDVAKQVPPGPTAP